MRVWTGHPFPLGATWDGVGVNFALFSEHATAVELCLFDPKGRRELARIVRLQFSPTIRFREDEIFEQASRIERLLHDPVVARDIAKRDDDDDDGGDAT